MYNFDEVINRRGTNSEKWDTIKNEFGREDLIPLSIADMDFKVGDFISNAIQEKIKEGVFGYNCIPDSYYESIISWNKKRHNVDIEKSWILFAPTVVQGIYFSLKGIVKEGDEVIIQPPVYPKFRKIIEACGCKVVENPLICSNEKYYMNIEDLEKKITNKTKVLILCSPHNPVGRVWRQEELERLCEILLKYDITIISDEIHSDLIFKGEKYISLGNLNEQIMNNAIIATAPTKTFNLAGIQVSNLIVPNKKIRDRITNIIEDNLTARPNAFATCALEAAYNEGAEYLEELLVYIEDNKDYAIEFFKKHIPKINPVESEGTYLLWLDCSKLNLDDEQLHDFFINKCKLILKPGISFGEDGKGFMRMNIACSRNILSKALNNIYKALNSI
ncbi:MalY/PatB family protein [Hathewaya histolytica]|uniref:cysteine-S-conjugate beta-lyase n=1 Tax=Hathewaya histolytica TaxID=1498 RepID=A0A4U9RLM7_HATHI|nr:MalY/PatB family protein [Hathewaya histolytica]VTQ93062.1 aspartate aminotransferase [Hathewaya histolytica]